MEIKPLQQLGRLVVTPREVLQRLTNKKKQKIETQERRKKKTITEEQRKRREEQSAQRRKKIEDFANKNDLQQREVSVGDYTVMILDGFEGDIPEEKLANYIAQYILKEERGTLSCYHVAENAVKSGVATGKIAARNVDSSFVPWFQHCINYDELDDGSVIAYDLTASFNIDEDQDNFHILLLRQENLESLLEKVDELYGGAWSVQDD